MSDMDTYMASVQKEMERLREENRVLLELSRELAAKQGSELAETLYHAVKDAAVEVIERQTEVRRSVELLLSPLEKWLNRTIKCRYGQGRALEARLISFGPGWIEVAEILGDVGGQPTIIFTEQIVSISGVTE